ncbi:MAG: MBL fold metallo-hydrolase [Solirubrobacterales bacterium]|nr:MBL fold metallo-hydrolase [Solirubrobacterales bacterium]
MGALSNLLAGGPEKLIAPGVWQLAGGLGHTMNVYLIEEPGGGVTVFDAGVEVMAPAILAAGARLGGIKRVVLGHADCDHRGAAPGLGAPVYVHPLEVEAARSPAVRRHYWNLELLAPWVRPLYAHLFFKDWDGGPVEVAGTLEEGDTVAGFRVVDLPGHAPGLIGLFREEDRLALVSDLIYTLNVETFLPGKPRVPHPAFNHDTDQARESVGKLAAQGPQAVWTGHTHPVSGTDVPAQLMEAAKV